MGIFDRLFSEYIVYTKIFQWISVNVDNPVLKYIDSFTRRFMNNAPYTDDDIDDNEIDRLMNLSSELSDILKIDNKPINSGTIALVFKGTLNGKDIAVKILRTGIAKKLMSAIANIRFIIQCLNYIPFVNITNDLFDDISGKLLEQVDLRIEFKNINMLYKVLRPYRISKQPQAYEKYCNENVVVMDFIHGTTIYDIDDSNRTEFANNFMTLNFHLILKKFIFHLDLHSGNVLFLIKDGKCKISLLDMGMVKIVNPRESNMVFDLMNFVFYRDGRGIANIIREYHDIIFRGKHDIEHISQSIEHEMEHHFKILEVYSVASDLLKVTKILKSHNCRISETFNIIILSFISTLSVVSALSDHKTVEGIIREKINLFRC